MDKKNFMQDPKTYESTAEILKAIAHPVRLCIVRGLLESEGCNVTYMQGCLNIPQSTISQHIAKLRSAKIIEGDRNGLEITYRLTNEKVKNIIQVLFEKN
ncbi:metalloregulator ArsR/SmtB family transcription factor [uncultured Clostridium sp.]|jgi:ArsR family transcriptional regulator|uniref:ArsR/SmtB family transcription factor n=1 Tax=uncultured Clostridium sp. TaxID=59620 RepID=UPI00260CEC7A|nr:metalloregulator ArsR/SmtB family transcription factor [uncultured Clostridium sp.]